VMELTGKFEHMDDGIETHRNMNPSSFSGFSIVFGMDSPVVSMSTTPLSPSLKAKKAIMQEVDGIDLEEAFVEPILRENPNRFTLFPIMKPKLFQKYKNHLAVFWTPEEIDLAKDMKDWVKLTPNEQHFIKNVLAFFAGSDGIIQENIAARFMNDIQLSEARQFYSVQLMMEAIHSESYSLLIDTYIEDKEEKLHLFQAIQTIPCVQKKAEWAQKWMISKDADFPTRLVAFAIVEGIFFSGSFCAIYWLKERGLMPGLTTSNEFIARDEGLHTDFACGLYEEIVRKIPIKDVHHIIKEAVQIEKEFITESLPCNLVGMNNSLMAQYIEFVADRLSSQLGYGKIYETANPFDFMERISLEGKDNFFEKRVSTYAKSGVGKTANEMSFALDADF
jgi:ribonucleotide reductase beta subunit family protein with ferritin-like domain